MGKMDRQVEESRKRIQEHKWLELEKRGIKRPKNAEENAQRLRDSRAGA